MIPVHTTGTYGGTPLTKWREQGSTGSGNAYVATHLTSLLMVGQVAALA